MNDNPKLRTFTVSPSATVTLGYSGPEPQDVSLSQLVNQFASGSDPGLGYWIWLEGGVVTAIKQQWVP